MRIEFEITDVPTGEQNKYITAYLEGILKIFIENTLFFNQPGILLVEYAIFVKKWLDKVKVGELVDFIYETMDNDEPILSITHVRDGYYIVDSIWKEREANDLLSKEVIINEFEKYLDNLEDAIKVKCNVS